MERRAGVLVHPTSLAKGDGSLAEPVRSFLAWAQEAGAGVWQVLPLGPPGPGGSPYNTLSAFAGDPGWFGDQASVDAERLAAFEREHAFWLDDWSLFAALKERHPGVPWMAWPAEIRRREPAALDAARGELGDAIARHRRLQYVFFAQWRALREEAKGRGIAILGDVPIYMAQDSADVWAHQDLFMLDAEGAPLRVAGVPPDYFSSTGQLWGNPLYRWDRARETGYAWWIARLRHGLALHDALRLDHFRGFAGYWSVPASAKTAADGAWETGPGLSLFEAARAALGSMPFVAEDLGVITEDVVELRRALGLPGMRVLQFGFDDPASEHAPHRLVKDTVVYTGTHDNDTARGWLMAQDERARRRVLDYVGGTADEIAWTLVRVAMTSVADLAIVPLQDLLGLESAARMNTPGIVDGNWRWRAADGALTADLAARFRRLAEISGRLA
ncbi:MAG TPA: 4-alpha-glucanotransferase [Candidatus Polarisedimenticolaceae bacterium]|nr:4-alpha-glucanotransferase [Candidatus Polarisedimenticolaceae bacterium]